MTIQEKAAALLAMGVLPLDAERWRSLLERCREEAIRAYDPPPETEQSIDRTRLIRMPDGMVPVWATDILAAELLILQLQAELANLMIHIVRGED